MFKTKIEVCGHQYIVRSKFPDGPDRADVFDSFDDLVQHLRCRLPIYPVLLNGHPGAVPVEA